MLKYVVVHLCLDLCRTWERARMVYCCCDSQRHLSHWLCTIKADCFFSFLTCFRASWCRFWDVLDHWRPQPFPSNHFHSDPKITFLRSWGVYHIFSHSSREAIRERGELLLHNKKALMLEIRQSEEVNVLSACWQVHVSSHVYEVYFQGKHRKLVDTDTLEAGNQWLVTVKYGHWWVIG